MAVSNGDRDYAIQICRNRAAPANDRPIPAQSNALFPARADGDHVGKVWRNSVEDMRGERKAPLYDGTITAHR